MPKVMSALWPLGRYFFARCVVGARLEAGVVDPLDAGMLLEMTRDGQRVLRVAFQAQMERLDSLQQQEGAVRRERGAGVAQSLDARFEDEGQRTKGLAYTRGRDTTGRAR